MNSNTLLRILGCFVLSACVCSVHSSDIAAPVGIRGAARPVVLPSAVEASADVINGVGGFGAQPSRLVNHIGAAVADDPTITSAVLAKDVCIAQAREADTQEKNATAAKKLTEEKSEEATEAVTEVHSAASKALKASQDAEAAVTAEDATVHAEKAAKEAKDTVEKAKIVEAAVKQTQTHAATSSTAAKAARVAADVAKARAAKAHTLDLTPEKSIAKVASGKAEDAEKSAVAAKISEEAAEKFLALANKANLTSQALVKNAETYVAAAKEAVKSKGGEEPAGEVVPPKDNDVSNPAASVASGSSNSGKNPNGNSKEKLPDTASKALMNYVKDGKYDYQEQLLKEDRCTDQQIKDTGCKKNSNCYVDHGTPVCICFPGFFTDDATKKACAKVDSPTCENDANTCHMNATCKLSKTLGVGCQCKDTFNGDGLLCSSAFSYVMNLFLLLAIASVQLYM